MNIERVLEGAKKLREAMDLLSIGPLEHTLTCLLLAQDLLFTKYAPFKVGDRVELARTPVITEKVAFGWIGSKHFLVEGAVGVVRSLEVFSDGRLRVNVAFDNESWKSTRTDEVHPIADAQKHTYCFDVCDLRAASSQDQPKEKP